MSLIERLQHWAVVALTILAVAVPAIAQEEKADPVNDEAFLRGLAEMGLGDVVLRIAKNPPSDPMEAAGLRDALISAYLPTLRAQGMDELLAGIDMLIEYQKQLLNEPANKDYWARPVWMADFGQQMMFSALPEVYQAGDFALVGFPDSTQRKAVDKIAATAFSQLRGADDEKLRLTQVLRADPDFVIKYINTGHWEKLNTYSQVNIPFYRAWAIAYLLTQSDSGPYFAKVNAPKDERAALIKQASIDLDTVLGALGKVQLLDDTQAQVFLLKGHLAIEQGKYDAAIGELVKAGSFKDASPYTKLLIELSRAKALQKSGKAKEATDLIASLRQHEGAKGNPLMQVLLTDRLFFAQYDKALTQTDPVKQQPILAKAFGAYDQLLAGDLLGDYKEAIRSFIEERYKDQVPAGIPAKLLPPTLRFAKIRGLVEKGEQLTANGQPAEAKPSYLEAIAEAKAFLETPNLPKAIEAQTMYYMGFAQLRTGQAGYALQTLTNVGEKFPDTEWGERAISIAVVNLAKPLYQGARDNDTVKQLYERALKVLLDKYPNTQLAELSTYDLAAFYRETEQYAKAVEAYKAVPKSNPAYLSGQFEKVACLGALWNDAPAGGAKVAQAEGIMLEVGNYTQIAERELSKLGGDEKQQLRQNIASAKLLKASAMIESMKLADDAGKVVDEVARDYSDIPSLKPRILGLRIRIYQVRGEYDKAEKSLLEYMRTDPDKAGPLALGVLKSLIDQVEELAASDAGADEMNKLADVAVNLAEKVVLPWAQTQGDIDPEQKLAYELIPAQALLAAKRAPEALKRYQALLTKYGKLASNNIDVIGGQAEANYLLKQYGNASVIYNRIIKHYQEQGLPKDSAYWHSYMRAMQMMDATSQGKNYDIAVSIRKKQQTYPDLGGEPFASVLKALLDKHAP